MRHIATRASDGEAMQATVITTETAERDIAWGAEEAKAAIAARTAGVADLRERLALWFTDMPMGEAQTFPERAADFAWGYCGEIMAKRNVLR